jgi:small subunit ribosomal protein S17
VRKKQKMVERKTKKAEKKVAVATRGRAFQGAVIKKFENRAVIEFDRTVYIKKYERFSKRKTKIHARIPEGMSIEVGDWVKARECRPLSKIVHFVVTEKVRSAEE